jgi:hypothetical protein
MDDGQLFLAPTSLAEDHPSISWYVQMLLALTEHF